MPKYKHGKINEVLEFNEWKEKMDNAKFHRQYHKSLLAFLYWTGVRISEAVERVASDFVIEDILIVRAPAKKGGERQPLQLPLDLPYVGSIMESVERAKRRRSKRVFPLSVRHARRSVKQVFGENVDGFTRAADRLGGTAVDAGDAAFEFSVFPHVPVQLILHAGDEEFPPEANILFDDSIGAILSPEDVAWLAGMVVYRLMALART